MNIARSLPWLSVAMAGLVTSAAAQNYGDSVFALHRKPAFIPSPEVHSLCPDPQDTTTADYSPNHDGVSCCDYTVSGPVGEESTVYVVLGNSGSQGIVGASFGIIYGDTLGTSGVGIEGDLVSWVSCGGGTAFASDGGFGNFPKPKGGILLVLGGCDQGAELAGGGWHYVLGVLSVYAYSADVLAVTPNNNIENGPELAIVDCSNTEYDLLTSKPGYPAGCFYPRVGFGDRASEGFTPCCSVCVAPARRSTWGGVKTRYQR